MKIFSSKKRVAVIGGLTAVTLVGGGTAFAYWSAGGGGTGSTTTGNTAATPFTVTFGTDAANILTPGGQTKTLPVTVHNPGTGHQHVASVEVKIAEPSGDPWEPVGGCRADDFQLEGSTLAAAGAPAIINTDQDLSPNGDSTGLIVKIQMINKSAPQNGCKDQVVPLFATVS